MTEYPYWFSTHSEKYPKDARKWTLIYPYFSKNSVHLLSYNSYPYVPQEAMESFTFPYIINPISIDIPQTYSKLYLFSLESFEDPLYVWNVFSKGKA